MQWHNLRNQCCSFSPNPNKHSAYTSELLCCPPAPSPPFPIAGSPRSPEHVGIRVRVRLCVVSSDQPPSIMSAQSLGFPVILQAAAQAVQRRHCFFLCLLVSNGNCTTKSQYVWNLAWGCFGYIEVFASALPDLNGDFTSTELKRRKGEEGGSAASGSERGRGPAHYIIIWTGIKWEGYDSLGLVKLWLKFYIHSFQGSHVLHLSREFRLSDVHEVCF